MSLKRPIMFLDLYGIVMASSIPIVYTPGDIVSIVSTLNYVLGVGSADPVHSH